MATSGTGVQSAVIAATGAGTHLLVAESAGNKIAIVKIHVSVSAACSVTLLDSGGATIAGPIPLDALGSFTWHADGEDWGKTAAGKALQIQLSAAATVGGILGYMMQ